MDTFVKKVCSGLNKVGDTCKPLEEEAFRVPENLPDERKMQCDVSFAWESRLLLQADIAGCHGGWYHSFIASCFYWARVGILRKFGYEAEISISGALSTANKVLEGRSAVWIINAVVASLRPTWKSEASQIYDALAGKSKSPRKDEANQSKPKTLYLVEQFVCHAFSTVSFNWKYCSETGTSTSNNKK